MIAERVVEIPKGKRDRMERLKVAQKYLNDGFPDEAWDIVDKILWEDPKDPRALLMACHIQEKATRYTIAYQFAERAVHIAPNICEVWFNYGRCCDIIYAMGEAEMAYKKALSLAKTPQQASMVLMNIGGMHVSMGEWVKAEQFSRQALEINPQSWKAKGNLAMACLGQRKWKEGWEKFRAVLGSEQRKFIKYNEENEWDGSKGKTVVIYGEQGIGDEVSFASMIPDAIRDCRKVIIDCDQRLAPLFRRSFPQAKVYGTRWAKAGDGQLWDSEDHKFDASVPMGGLGQFYRNKDEDFPGTPYLIPDPERVSMWKHHFDSQRPAIGIAWSGGMPWTAAHVRKWKVEDLKDLLTVPAHWVCLQYKDAEKEIQGTNIKQYKYGTLTKDYDDTAALVAGLDLVVCMQTAVAELCGAIGKECWVFVPQYTNWRYGQGEDVPWYKSVKVFRQREDGSWPLDEARKLLMLRYG